MKKRIISALLLGLSLNSFAEKLYTDGSGDLRTCVQSGKMASIDFPCKVVEIYYTDEIEADIKAKAPNTVVFGLKPDKKEGSLTAVCSNTSYTIVIKEGNNCDNHKVIVDKRFVEKKDLEETEFNKEQLLNQARGLLKGMIRGEPVRGYEIKPLKGETVINNDDYFKAHFSQIYDGSVLVGFIGRIKNYSNYIDKYLNVRKIMKKGYVLFYVEGMDGEVVRFRPQEERRVFIVALKSNHTAIPYKE